MSTRNYDDDMMVLTRAFVQNLQRDNFEYGGWGVDCKRPFGNSFVEGDILRMLGIAAGEDGYTAEQRGYAASLYDGLGEFMRTRVVLALRAP